MTLQFSFNEALKFAISREKESQALYKNLSAKTSNPEVKDIFDLLYKQEVKHEMIFSEILSKTLPDVALRPSEDDTVITYIIDELNANKSPGEDALEPLDAPIIALEFAISREKDAIIFYTGLRELVAAEDREKINGIIWEEARHALIISNFRQKFLNNQIGF